MRRKLCLILLLTVAGIGLSTGHAAAKQARFKQLILPLDCVFETVNDGLGTIHYLTPAECGQIIPPSGGNSGQGDNTGTGNTATSQTTPPRGTTARQALLGPLVPDLTPPPAAGGHGEVSVVSGGSPLLLNNRVDAVSQHGYSVRVHSGNVLFYRPTDNSSAVVRSLTISSVDKNGIGILIQPLQYRSFIAVHQTVVLDQLLQGSPALRIEVRSIQGQYADVNFRLLNPPSKKRQAPLPVAAQAAVLILTIIIMVLLRLKPQWFGLWRR